MDNKKFLHNKFMLSILSIFIISTLIYGCGDKEGSPSNITKEIESLPKPSYTTLKDAAKIDEIKDQFEKLSADDKKKVKNADKLKQEEDVIKAIKEGHEAADKDFKVSEKVSQEIKNLNINDSKEVEKVTKDYDSLTEAQKTLVVDSKKINR